MESDIDHLKGSQMNILSHGIVLLLCAGLSGCELLCQAGTGTCGMSKEQRRRVLNPKTYGEFWTKPSMTKESWRQDWVECGGMPSGQYTTEIPRGLTHAAALPLWNAKEKELDTCMQSKGYTFRYTY